MDDIDFDVINPQFLAAVLDKAFAAWNSNDGDALAALCTEDGEWIDAATPSPLKGRSEVAGFVAWFFVVLPDGRFELVGEPAISVDGRTAYQPWRLTGTNTGPLDPLISGHSLLQGGSVEALKQSTAALCVVIL